MPLAEKFDEGTGSVGPDHEGVFGAIALRQVCVVFVAPEVSPPPGTLGTRLPRPHGE